MAAFDPDVARQFSQPARAETTPERETETSQHYSENDEQFPDLRHFRNVAPKPGQINLTGRSTVAEATYSSRRGGSIDEVDLREEVLPSPFPKRPFA